MQRPGETHLARSSTKPTRWEGGRQEEMKEGVLPAWEKSLFQPLYGAITMQLLSKGMCCWQLSAKPAELRGPAKDAWS